MIDPLNPYAAPTSQQLPSDHAEVPQAVVPAGQGARFANFVIDYLAQFAISFVLGVVIAVVGGEPGAAFLEQTPGILIGLPILFGYYFVLEATTARTLGKFITGTKVVNQYGRNATLGQIAGRTLCRVIPFEAFSFFGTPTRGWHDRIPNTFVVKQR